MFFFPGAEFFLGFRSAFIYMRLTFLFIPRNRIHQQ